MGHDPTGLDASNRLCEMAREWSGCEVWQQDLRELTLPKHTFDGVFANASLFHVPTQNIDGVLVELRRTHSSRVVCY